MSQENQDKDRQNVSLERVKLRNELLRFFFGTFLIAVLTMGFNALLKYWELKSEADILRYNTYDKYLDRFDNTKDKIDKIVLAKTLSFIAPDEELRKGYEGLYQFLEKNYGKESELAKAKIEKETEQQIAERNFMLSKPDVATEFKSLASKLDARDLEPNQKMEAEKKYDELVNSNPELKEIVTLESKIKETESLIESVKKESTIPTNSTVLVEDSYITKNGWFKEGYMVNYGDIRINCDELDTKNGQAEIRVEEKVNGTFTSLSTFVIDEGKSKEISGGKYVFRFTRIGKAGKNPFNTAVYFEFKMRE